MPVDNAYYWHLSIYSVRTVQYSTVTLHDWLYPTISSINTRIISRTSYFDSPATGSDKTKEKEYTTIVAKQQPNKTLQLYTITFLWLYTVLFPIVMDYKVLQSI